MNTNVGPVDRTIRIILGLVIAAVGIYYQSWWGLVAIVPLFTAFVKWCPLYLPFGLSTCRTKMES
ncbi:DUF2892 domain-containing protein [bacterium]|nr:DUF2892 domain-containing protein [bacterium]